MLVGLVVLTAALWGGLAGSGALDARAAGDAPAPTPRHAVVHEHGVVLRAVFPLRDDHRGAKGSLRELFAVLACAPGAALLLAVGRRPTCRTTARHPSFVRFGAPRAPPALQLQP
jgi:hypothetical protein